MAYAWTIIRDHLATNDDDSAVGVSGPRDATAADLARLAAGEGDIFTLRDDDRELYLTGRAVVSGGQEWDEEACYAPLADYGASWGCVMVEWPGHHERDCG